MSNDSSATIVSKVWNYAHVLKNAGVGYGDYVEVRAAPASITYQLFLKLADEMTELGFDNPIPEKFQWSELSSKSGDELEVHYRHTLENLGTEPGLVGIIFRKAQNKISNPSDLARVVVMIADEDWSGMDVDIKGAIYEGCEPHRHFLEKTASSSDKGAGQYFYPASGLCGQASPREHALAQGSPRAPSSAPSSTSWFRSQDRSSATPPAAPAASSSPPTISSRPTTNSTKPPALTSMTDALRGTDIVPGVVSLCAMNLYLHGIGSTKDANDPPVDRADALAQPSGRKFDMILANPPFGKKSGYTIVGEDGKISTEKQEYERDEFCRSRDLRSRLRHSSMRYRAGQWATTSNKQLNFLQHIVSELAIGGSAAVVLPDNVLFEGGDGDCQAAIAA